MPEIMSSEQQLLEELEPKALGHAGPQLGQRPEEVLTGNYWMGEDYESATYFWIC